MNHIEDVRDELDTLTKIIVETVPEDDIKVAERNE
jgi:hypothetical protein